MLQGTRADLAYRPFNPPPASTSNPHFSLRALAVVGEFGFTHAANTNGSGINLSLATFLAGPRYARPLPHGTTAFAQFLAGGVRGFDSLFPVGISGTSSANSFAFAVSGGLDYQRCPRFAFRLVQIDYLRTFLPNNADNAQNNLRVGAGIVFRSRHAQN